jgi:hypothetical protein
MQAADRAEAKNSNKPKKGKKQAAKPQAIQSQAYMNVHYPMLPKYKTKDWETRTGVIQSLTQRLTSHIYERCPDAALLKMNTKVNRSLIAPPITADTPEEKYPNTMARFGHYVTGVFVTQS